MNCSSIIALESSVVLLEGTVTEENGVVSLKEDKKISPENPSRITLKTSSLKDED